MISKRTTFKIESVEILDNCMVKLASFDLPKDESYDPDFLYIKVRAVSAGEYYGDNKNGDWFPAEELKRTYHTFLTAHVFKNHENKDVANAIGEVLSAVWDDAMKCVVLILKVDRKIAPTVTRSIEKGYMTDVSMGCRVPYSICSICGNKARNPKEYCEHIRLYRRRIFPDGRKAYEININPKFHDISVVLNGAEKVAKITDIYDANQAKKSKSVSSVEKVAAVIEDTMSGSMEKVASYEDALASSFEMPTPSFMTKQAEAEKKAELHKRIEGMVLNSARHNLMNERRGLSDARIILKAAFTKYWSPKELDTIALKLKTLAVKSGKSKQDVFRSFLCVLDFAGIELTPAELSGITKRLFGLAAPEAAPSKNIVVAIRSADKGAENDAFKNCSLSQALPLLSAIMQGGEVPKLIARIKRVPVSEPVIGDGLCDAIMKNIVKREIPLRSMHTMPIVRRIRIIKKPMDSTGQFDASDFGKHLYAMYQNDRAQRLLSGASAFGAMKYASDIDEACGLDKTAKDYSKIRAALVGTPIIYGYSKYQRARIDNGEDVSSLNRFAAQYPEAIAGLNVMFGPAVYKGTKKQVAKAVEKASVSGAKALSKMKSLAKHAELQETLIGLYENGYDREADALLEKTATTREDLMDSIGLRVYEKQRELISEIEKTAAALENDDFEGVSDSDFIQSMAIAKLITEKN